MNDILDDGGDERPIDGIGLCLSGGGYRAMIFHVGALWRLRDAGLLPSLTHVASVSGGSITAGILALAWPRIIDGGPDSFTEHVVAPARRLAGITIDRGAILGGAILPGSIGEYVAGAYATHLFGDATLQDLPETPRFIFCATNLETGTLWRFSKKEMRDWRVGQIKAPRTPICEAVAASSAFPPILSPFVLDVEPEDFSVKEPISDAFRTEISLTDGGVYDNLGIEPIWKRCETVLVSDGGGRLAEDASPPGNWAQQSKRVLEVIDHQVRNLRKLQVVRSLDDKRRRGAYWGVRTDIADYELADALPCPAEQTLALAEIATRLRRMPDEQQERLINWGYAVTDAALRRYYRPDLPAPTGFPYPASGVGE